MKRAEYLIPGRLEDVVLLVQFLAMRDNLQVAANTISRELGIEPASEGLTSWQAVAKAHPEFFRISGKTAYKEIGLLARYAARKSDLEPLGQEAMTALIGVALQLHERQARSAESRNAYLPLWGALVGGVFTLLATIAARWAG